VVNLQPGEKQIIDTGIRVSECSASVGLFIRARSRHFLTPLSVFHGTIDSDYRGRIKVGVQNTGTEILSVSPDEAIAQLVPVAIITTYEQADHVLESERGERGGINGIHSV